VIVFSCRTLLPLPPDEAFDLGLSIDAHLDSMAWSDERAVAGVRTGLIGLGEFVTWRARHFGVTWTMTSEVTEWDRPHRFVDEQQHGPFKSFWHEHLFSPCPGGTEVVDHVRFEAPLGPLGWIAEQAVLKRYLPRLIRARNDFMLEAAQAKK
jgi:ligand-binding SRPBCC domain-containing protein